MHFSAVCASFNIYPLIAHAHIVSFLIPFPHHVFPILLLSQGDEVTPRILVVGATNRPHEIDEAARRRLVKKLYVPLPNAAARGQLMRRLLRDESSDINDEGRFYCIAYCFCRCSSTFYHC